MTTFTHYNHISMKAYVFPGQGAQFEGMGKDLYESSPTAKAIFDIADQVLGYKLSDIMFNGSAEDLKETKVTQPALFVHAIAKLVSSEKSEQLSGVAGHSLGEFSALVAAKVVDFEDGLKLVYERAMAMQAACDDYPGTMAAVLGLEDAVVEDICKNIDEIVVAANYNCQGQLVISGSKEGIEKAINLLKEAGAKRALVLPVGGAFHSPLMKNAEVRLAKAINEANFNTPICPVYQNVTAKGETDPVIIKENLIKQLTGSVKWTQTILQMSSDGIVEYIEVGGTGKVLSGLISKINKEALVGAL
jgi:[acyl-carrier-protein] S-malonyltransferase